MVVHQPSDHMMIALRSEGRLRFRHVVFNANAGHIVVALHAWVEGGRVGACQEKEGSFRSEAVTPLFGDVQKQEVNQRRSDPRF